MAEEVYREALHGEEPRSRAVEVAAALDAVEAVLREAQLVGAGEDSSVATARLAFFARWIERAGWSYAPDEVRTLVEDRAAGYARRLLDELAQGEPRDLRLDLAAAYALRDGIGDQAIASRLLADLPEAGAAPATDPPMHRHFVEENSRSESARREPLVRFLATSGATHPARVDADPFDHFVEQVGVRESAPQIDTAVWPRLQARLAEATGYPEMAGYFLAESCRWLHLGSPDLSRRELAPFGGLPAAVLAELDRLEASLRHAAEEIVAETDRLAAGRPWVTPLRCRIPGAQPIFAPEPVPLPAGADLEVLRGRRPTDWQTPPSHLDALDFAFQLPGDRVPVDRFEHRGELLMLALPDGLESSAGDDYALLRSADGGATWGPPLATGLRVRGPFEVVAGSPRNRIEGGRLHLESADGLQPVTEAADRHLPSWRTRPILGPGMPLDPLRASDRLVVIDGPPAGPDPALAVSLFALDHASDRALVLLRPQSAAESLDTSIDRYLLERSEETGEWRLTHSVDVGGCVTVFMNHDLPVVPAGVEGPAPQ